MKYLTILTPTLAALTRGRATPQTTPLKPLQLELEVVSNTGVKASITNTGPIPVKVLKTGSILDSAPAVEKVKISQDNGEVDFAGVHYYIATELLGEDDFQIINASETVSTEFDIAATYHVKETPDSKNPTKIISLEWHPIITYIDAHAATETREKLIPPAEIQKDCTDAQVATLVKAFALCHSRAEAALAAAKIDIDKLTEYFKTASPEVRTTVTDVFRKIAAECNSNAKGFSRQYCSDRLSACRESVIAYAWPEEAYVVYCPPYFTWFEEESHGCHSPDRTYVTIHEMTHLREIKETTDYGVYGYEAVRALTAEQNLNHADTYAMFANAIDVGGSCA